MIDKILNEQSLNNMLGTFYIYVCMSPNLVPISIKKSFFSVSLFCNNIISIIFITEAHFGTLVRQQQTIRCISFQFIFISH